jgi:hypothetical protein
MKENKALSRLISLLSGAGFMLIGHSCKPWKNNTIKLQVIPTKEAETPYPEEAEYSETPETNIFELERRNAGETCDLMRFLRARDWRHAFNLVQEVLRSDSSLFNLGDFLRVEFDVPAATHDGVDFPALHIKADVQIVEVVNDKAIFNFEEIIFCSAINAKDTNKGGIHASALAKYLNTEFLTAFGISDVLLDCNGTWEVGNAHKISIPTATEIFGDSEYWEPESNFDEPEQHSFFRKIKNRIKVFEDDTHWYWTASARASSAALFCRGSSGASSHHSASAVGGVAPAFCVA